MRLGLTRAAGFLRGELGRRLGLRHAPRLEFVFDDSAVGAERLSSLIDRAVAADRAHTVSPAATEPAAASPEEPADADMPRR